MLFQTIKKNLEERKMIELATSSFVIIAFALFGLGFLGGIFLLGFGRIMEPTKEELKNQVESLSMCNTQLENEIAAIENRLGSALKENSEMRKRIYPIKNSKSIRLV